ncbi:unnamed protein product [Acanthoscelides obtectus]|uniref:Endonuclease/exonuclease/phosphatase domain-containing protein n=1 Tax=Acanthoscelides obtectus TaxID=200917 RepID=A0A9P0JVH6_ACAOB|nr:unnamed protein product [Acanthoscelides obtectus]CAK1625239.1 hypothetical protein AOBTE_LOCUS3051 [Acanthoscelides obtectus]
MELQARVRGKKKSFTDIDIAFQPNLILLNVQCLNIDKVNQLHVMVSDYARVKFFCLTETWATAESLNNFVIGNFQLVSSYFRSSYKGGGLVIYCRNDVVAKPIDVSQFSLDKNIELCAIQFSNGGIRSIIILCYRSPSGDMKIFHDNLNRALNFVFRPNINIILCGDFNVDSYNGLHPQVGWPTRIGRTSITTIHQVFTNFNDKCLNSLLIM